MKVLLVEDDHRISLSIKTGLEQENFLVDVAFNGETGYEMAFEDGYDVILLDVMLPLLDGIEVCKRLRQHKKMTPILMLTAKSSISDTVTGLESGADDYVTKPFAFEELLARINALARRPRTAQQQTLTLNDLELDIKTHSVTRNKVSVTVSKKEFLLLEFLLRNVNTVVSKEQIIQHVWEYDTDVLPNTVEVYIGYLRNKLEKPFTSQKKLIKTVRGVGYMIQG